jgi:ribonucleoside-diphosphate reductase alpha chain
MDSCLFLWQQVVPEYEKLKNQYELLWDIKDNEGYLQLCAIMQKFVDQAISANTHYDPSLFKGNKVPMKLCLLIDHCIVCPLTYCF